MPTAKIFRSGKSQVLRLPKQFRFKSKDVEIFRRGDEIVLRERKGVMMRAFELLFGMPDGFEPRDRNETVPSRTRGSKNWA